MNFGDRPLVSIIVPVYNVEKYLDRCINSLLEQTYDNIEIILVNDGSTDGSVEKCNTYARNNSKVKLINKKNGGLSSARNEGLKIAKGDYITFVDSDDWVSSNIYEHCIYLLNKYKSDAVRYGFEKTDQIVNCDIHYNESIDVYKGKEILRYYMHQSTIDGSYAVWRLFCKKELLIGIYFREGKINEDIDYLYKVFLKCKSLVVTNKCLYYYYQSGNSLSVGGLKKRDFDLYDAALELYKLAENEEYKDIRFLALVKKARTPFSLLCKMAYCGISDASINKKKIVTKLQKQLRSNLLILLKSPMGVKRKILCILFALSFKLAENTIKFAKMRKII